MHKRHRLNLALLLLLVLLALVAWLEPGKAPAPSVVSIGAPAPEAIRRIRIERPAGALELARRDGLWRLTSPVDIAANGARIDALLALAGSESLARQAIGAGEDLAPYGLDKPQLTLWLNDRRIDFGRQTPLDNRRYLRIGETLHLISDARYYTLLGKWTDYISPRLIPDGERLARIELPDWVLNDDQGRWLPDPRPENWSADAATALAQRWQNAQAMQISEEAGGAAQGDAIRLYLRGQDAPLRFVISAREPGLVLLRPDLGLAWHLAGKAEDLLHMGTVD